MQVKPILEERKQIAYRLTSSHLSKLAKTGCQAIYFPAILLDVDVFTLIYRSETSFNDYINFLLLDMQIETLH